MSPIWPICADKSLTLETLLVRCEAVCIGIDGGGLNNLLSLAVIGRARDTRKWLVWCHARTHGCNVETRS